MKRVAFLSPEAHTGLAYHDYELLHAMLAARPALKINYFCPSNYLLLGLSHKFEVQTAFSKDGVSKVGTAIRYARDMAALTVRLLRSRPDIVHAEALRIPLIDSLLIKAVRLAGIKCILTVHDATPLERGMIRMLNHARLYTEVDRLIVYSGFTKEELLNRYRLPSAKLHQSFLGVNSLFTQLYPACSEEEARERVGLPPRCPVVLFFGVIRKSKGLDVLLQAFAAARNRLPGNTRLLIVGKTRWPGEEDTYLQMRGRLGLNDSVLFRFGFVSDGSVAHYFSAADLVVTPYLQSFQSAVAMVAYSYRKPLLASRVGGLAEVVDDGKTGFLVEPGDVTQLASSLVEALSDLDRLKRMGQCAHDWANVSFPWSSTAKETLSAYDLVLASQ